MAQHAAKSWRERRRKKHERTATLAQLAAEELSSTRHRARLEHLVEGIGHQVGDQLEPLLAAKFRQDDPAGLARRDRRPAAADQRWPADEGFGSVVLDQMNPNDVRTFLRRRHEAARDADSLPCAPEDLPEAERRLLRQLGNRPHLRALTASPLLCALNLGRASELPQSRMELYRAAGPGVKITYRR
nr:hypothetical protein [Saccharothrix sp.]